MLRQADLYFERCHAAERDPRVSPADRRTCWKAWLTHYGIAQRPERVGHAEARSVAVAPEVHGANDANSGDEFRMAAGAAEANSDGIPSSSGTEDCRAACTSRQMACVSVCAGDAEACKSACESEARVCHGACL